MCSDAVHTCREDIGSADQAVAAVAHLLHQVVPDGDVSAAVQKLAQVKRRRSAVHYMLKQANGTAHNVCGFRKSC